MDAQRRNAHLRLLIGEAVGLFSVRGFSQPEIEDMETNNTDELLRDIAFQQLKGRKGFQDYLSGDVPEAMTKAGRLAEEAFAKDLSADDHSRFGPFAPIVQRGGGSLSHEHAVARAKLCLLVDELREVIRSEFIVDGEFPKSNVAPLLSKIDVDDDGLVDVADLQPLPDAFGLGEHAVRLADPAPYPLRRALSAVHAGLARKGSPRGRLKVQLDPYDVIAKRDYREALMEAQWFGPPFSGEWLWGRLEAAKEVTVQKRVEPEEHFAQLELRAFYAKENQLDITRKQEAGRTAFLFELLDKETDLEDDSLVRTSIFHSDHERPADEEGRRFSHADTSLLIYRAETYLSRVAAESGAKVKAEAHYKFFWLSGPDEATWVTLLRASFPRSELVDEFLSGQPWQSRYAAEG